METEFAGRLKFRWNGLEFTCSSHQELLIVNFDFAFTLGICILARGFVDVAFVCRRDLKLRASVLTVSIYIARCFAWLIKPMIRLGSSNPDARPGRVHRMSFNSIGQPWAPGYPLEKQTSRELRQAKMQMPSANAKSKGDCSCRKADIKVYLTIVKVWNTKAGDSLTYRTRYGPFYRWNDNRTK